MNSQISRVGVRMRTLSLAREGRKVPEIGKPRKKLRCGTNSDVMDFRKTTTPEYVGLGNDSCRFPISAYTLSSRARRENAAGAFSRPWPISRNGPSARRDGKRELVERLSCCLFETRAILL